jgi:hypothetical protein
MLTRTDTDIDVGLKFVSSRKQDPVSNQSTFPLPENTITL